MDVYVNQKTRVRVRVPKVVGERLGPDWHQPATPTVKPKPKTTARKPVSGHKK